jgi:hypothetical protein
MLTLSSSSRARFLLPLPLMVVFILCFTKTSFSGERKLVGNKLTLNGNLFEMKIYPKDTMVVENPATGEVSMKVVGREPSPITLNGERIYQTEDLAVPVLVKGTSQKEFTKWLGKKLKNSLHGLKDGRYTVYMSSFVVDKRGKVAYYEDPFILVPEKLREDKEVEEQKQRAMSEMSKIITGISSFEPAVAGGNPVHAFYSVESEPYKFEVKNHIVTLVE